MVDSAAMTAVRVSGGQASVFPSFGVSGPSGVASGPPPRGPEPVTVPFSSSFNCSRSGSSWLSIRPRFSPIGIGRFLDSSAAGSALGAAGVTAASCAVAVAVGAAAGSSLTVCTAAVSFEMTGRGSGASILPGSCASNLFNLVSADSVSGKAGAASAVSTGLPNCGSAAASCCTPLLGPLDEASTLAPNIGSERSELPPGVQARLPPADAAPQPRGIFILPHPESAVAGGSEVAEADLIGKLPDGPLTGDWSCFAGVTAETSVWARVCGAVLHLLSGELLSDLARFSLCNGGGLLAVVADSVAASAPSRSGDALRERTTCGQVFSRIHVGWLVSGCRMSSGRINCGMRVGRAPPNCSAA
mmetsp:Transcript_143465/g.267384  ORF Transcript_143465/g.267384 Transcript_143465/m.267384 type:complete len:359 (+) Transcript_143465:316-1392(+)